MICERSCCAQHPQQICQLPRGVHEDGYHDDLHGHRWRQQNWDDTHSYSSRDHRETKR